MAVSQDTPDTVHGLDAEAPGRVDAFVSYAREDIAFIRRLDEALETDLAWADAHARLLVRAREWRLHHHGSSYLLRGRDLRAAEDWLAREGEHRERAAPAQKAYIAASRQFARRTRLALVA